MNTTLLIIIGCIVILASWIWRLQIRKSKEKDSDYEEQHKTLLKAKESDHKKG